VSAIVFNGFGEELGQVFVDFPEELSEIRMLAVHPA
jgi:hypothetical protein